jgi:hypothetical protein
MGSKLRNGRVSRLLGTAKDWSKGHKPAAAAGAVAVAALIAVAVRAAS